MLSIHVQYRRELLIPEFLKHSEKLDALRGESTRDTFLELSSLWEVNVE